MAFTASVDILDSNGDSIVQQDADGTTPVIQIQLGAGLVGTWSKDGDVGTVTITPDPASPISGTTIALGTGYKMTAYAAVITTDATVTNIGDPIAIPSGKMVGLRARVIANLIGDGLNPAGSGGRLVLDGLVGPSAVPGTPEIAPGSGDDASIGISPFGVASPVDTPAAGKLALVISGSSAQLQVMGKAYGDIAAWLTGTSYSRGNLVTGAGGALYVAMNGGTSGATQPAGTGAAVSDGVVTWRYVSNDGTVRVSWTLLLEILTG